MLDRLLSSGGELISGGGVVAGARGAIDIIVIPLVILFGGLFAVGKPRKGLFSTLLRALPKKHRERTDQAGRLLAERLVDWLRGQLLAMLAVGIMAVIAFWIIGVPYALLLGIVNGLAEFIPIAGPLLGAVPALIIAAVDDPMKAIWVAVAMTAVQQIESAFVTPLAMSTSVRVHPFVTLFALLMFGSLFGFLGVLLAVPLVLLIWTAVEVYWIDEADARG
jgi:predicted PurR-regulated permease PerM